MAVLYGAWVICRNSPGTNRADIPITLMGNPEGNDDRTGGNIIGFLQIKLLSFLEKRLKLYLGIQDNLRTSIGKITRYYNMTRSGKPIGNRRGSNNPVSNNCSQHTLRASPGNNITRYCKGARSSGATSINRRGCNNLRSIGSICLGIARGIKIGHRFSNAGGWSNRYKSVTEC